MQIKRICEKDVPAVAQALMLAYAVEPWNEKWTEEKACRRVRAIMSHEGAMGLAAEESGDVIAAAMGYVDPYADEDFLFISEIFVIPGQRKRGIGARLMERMEQEANSRGIRGVQLITIGENDGFYRKCGMEKDCVSVMYKRSGE